MEFIPMQAHESAGIVLLQNDDHQIRCAIILNEDGVTIVHLIRCEAGIDRCLNERKITSGRVYLKVEAREQAYQFWILRNLHGREGIWGYFGVGTTKIPPYLPLTTAIPKEIHFVVGNHIKKWHTLGNPVDDQVLRTPVG